MGRIAGLLSIYVHNRMILLFILLISLHDNGAIIILNCGASSRVKNIDIETKKLPYETDIFDR